MKPKTPKIKPRLMWAVIDEEGSPRVIRLTKASATCWLQGSNTVQRVLVTEPPKRGRLT